MSQRKAGSANCETPIRVRVKVSAYDLVCECIEYAAERACNRHDKYAENPLSEQSRALLLTELDQSFWLAVGDRGIEFVSGAR